MRTRTSLFTREVLPFFLQLVLLGFAALAIDAVFDHRVFRIFDAKTTAHFKWEAGYLAQASRAHGVGGLPSDSGPCWHPF